MMLYCVVLLGLVVLTQTRGAWVGVMIIFATFVFWVDRRFLFKLALLPALLFVPAVADRLGDLGKGTAYTGEMRSADDAVNSFAWRQLMWQSALEHAAGSLFLGKGLASFGPDSLVFFPLANPNYVYSEKAGVGAHNAFVQALYETGIVGLCCYLAIFISILLRIMNAYRFDPKGAWVAASIVIAFIAATFSDNMFDYGAVNLYFWGIVGVILSVWERQKEVARITVRRAKHISTSGPTLVTT
jgi:O-antigen ligase